MAISAIDRLMRLPKDRALWNKAQQKLLHGKYAAALSDYRNLTKRFPDIAELWFEFGNAASGYLDFDLANQAYRRALAVAPEDANLLSLIGHQYQNLRQLDHARNCYTRAVEINPDSVDARINLAVWLEKDRRLDEAWDHIDACLSRHPQDDQARYFKAFLQYRRNDHESAEATLRELIHSNPRYPYVQYASRHLLGVVLDAQGHFNEAMRWLLAGKDIVRTMADTRAMEASYDAAQHARIALLSDIHPHTLRQWREQAMPQTPSDRQFAFLGGHPRSGTTLLEQILDANPALLAFDEPVAFSQEISTPLAHPSSGFSNTMVALDQLSHGKRAELREHYERSLLREVNHADHARVLLDKNPSPTASLLTWLRVFPELKVIIALRDPRDVVMSCFFLNIMLNATNVNFLSIERTIKHYTDLMGVWLRMREINGFDWIESRYEDVVADVEGEGRKVTEFLGLAWHDDQARFHETARRKVVFAPTYHDVTRKVYASAIGRWQRYASVLEPYQEILAPFCRAFGYHV